MRFSFHPSDVDLSLGTPVERKPRGAYSPRIHLLWFRSSGGHQATGRVEAWAAVAVGLRRKFSVDVRRPMWAQLSGMRNCYLLIGLFAGGCR